MIFRMLDCMVAAQGKSGVENYNQFSKGKQYLWMPVVHYQTKKGLYAEMRYNYDDINTFSFYGGKSISGGKQLEYTVVPMLGFSVGNFESIAAATKMELNYRKSFMSAEVQYNHALRNEQTSFFFTWPEIGIDISEFLFAGIAAQYTIDGNIKTFEPGLMAGINFKNFSIPFYLFNPFRSNNYLVIGLNYEYNLKPKKR